MTRAEPYYAAAATAAAAEDVTAVLTAMRYSSDGNANYCKLQLSQSNPLAVFFD